jgi:radical SAM protein with 4Fe4S-binding SPASM domain
MMAAGLRMRAFVPWNRDTEAIAITGMLRATERLRKFCMSTYLNRYGGLAAGHDELQKLYFREKRLYSLQIESIDACEQGCIYCYAGSTSQQRYGLASGEIIHLLNTVSEMGVQAVDWLGGDPLVRTDWYELMRRAAALGLKNNLWTSGLPLADDAVAEKVLEVTDQGFVSVHVDSITPGIYSKLHPRGNVQNIDRILKGVQNLKSLGKLSEKLINCITFTALQGPEDAIQTMKWFFEELGMRTCLTLFNPSGSGAELRHLVPDPDSIRKVFRARDNINFGGDSVTISAMDTDKYYCGTMATVTFTGDVTPCSVIRRGVDNIRNRPFRDILSRHMDTLIHGELHDTCNLPSPCDRCDNNPHCWGCRASAFNYNGDANGIDPKCLFIEKQNEIAS